MDALRCPFCHDALRGEGPDEVACQACRAEHHLACFLEHPGCAATGCRAEVALVGETEVPLAALRELATDPARLRRVARQRLRLAGAVTAIATIFVLVGIGAFLAELVAEAFGSPGLYPAGAVLGLAVALLALRPGGAARRAPPLESELPVRIEERGTTFDAVWGIWRPDGHVGMLGTVDALGPLRARLERGAPPAPAGSAGAPPPAPAPGACPACGGALDDPDEDDAAQEPDDEQDSAPLTFCFHCGVDLTPVEGGAVEGEPGADDGEPGADDGEPGAVVPEPGGVEAKAGAVEAEPGAVEAEPGGVEAEPGERVDLTFPAPGACDGRAPALPERLEGQRT